MVRVHSARIPSTHRSIGFRRGQRAVVREARGWSRHPRLPARAAARQCTRHRAWRNAGGVPRFGDGHGGVPHTQAPRRDAAPVARLSRPGPARRLAAGRGRGGRPRRACGAGAGPSLWSAPRRAGGAGRLRAPQSPAHASDPELDLPDNNMAVDNPPDGFLRIDFDRGADPTFNSHIGTLYAKRGTKGTRDEFVMGFRVHKHMCNPVGGLHGGMMMSVADLVGTMGGGTQVGVAKFLPTVSMTFDFVAPAKLGDWVEGRAEVVRQTRSLLFTNISLTVGEERILRASQIAKIPSGDGLAFGKARLDRGAEMAAERPSS